MTVLPFGLLVPCLCFKCYLAPFNYRKPQCFLLMLCECLSKCLLLSSDRKPMCLPSCWVLVCSSLLRSCWPGCVSCALNSSSWIRAHSIRSALHHTQIHISSEHMHDLIKRNTGGTERNVWTSLANHNHFYFVFVFLQLDIKLMVVFLLFVFFAEWITNIVLQQQAKVRKFGPKILQLLTEWTETFPSDFRDEKMVGYLKDFIHRIAPCDEVCWWHGGGIHIVADRPVILSKNDSGIMLDHQKE